MAKNAAAESRKRKIRADEDEDDDRGGVVDAGLHSSDDDSISVTPTAKRRRGRPPKHSSTASERREVPESEDEDEESEAEVGMDEAEAEDAAEDPGDDLEQLNAEVEPEDDTDEAQEAGPLGNEPEQGNGNEGQEREEEAEEEEERPPLELIERWLPRQKLATSRLLAGERPVLPKWRLGGTDPHQSRLVGLEKQYRFLRQTVHGTLALRASNSVAILGPSGSGKHALLEAALDSVVEEAGLGKAKAPSKGTTGSDPDQERTYFHIRLDGLLQPTDPLCLRALARQLVEQGAFEESAISELVGDVTAADGTKDADGDGGPDDEPEQTLDPLRDLEIDEDDDGEEGDEDDEDGDKDEDDDDDSDSGESDNVLGPKVRASKSKQKKSKDGPDPRVAEKEKQAMQQALFSSISSATKVILSLLTTPVSANADLEGPILSKPLVISISNFQSILTRETQALLYCLLDAVQASSYAPGLLVVGISHRPDVEEMMEKRVKSRFSHRFVHVFPVANLESWESRRRRRRRRKATQEESEKAEEKFTVLDVVRHGLLAAIPSLEVEKKGEAKEEREVWTRYWSSTVEKLLKHGDFQISLRTLWDRSNNVKLLHQILRPVIASLNPSRTSPLLDPRVVNQAFAKRRMNTTETLIRGLTMPELTLLVTANHIKHRGREVFNFEMCWDGLSRYLSGQADRGENVRSFRTSTIITRSGGGGSGSSSPVAAKSAGSSPAASASASPYGKQVRLIGQGGEERSRASRADRLKAKNAFKSLLELELFIPDAALANLNMPSLAGGLGGLSASRKGSLLRDELVPVRCQVEKGHIEAMLTEMAKPGNNNVGVDQLFVNWAKGSGL